MPHDQRLCALVVDDDADVIEFISHVLETAHCDVTTARDGDDALERAAECNPDVVFLDIRIPKQDGWLVCSKLKIAKKSPVVVLITGFAERQTDRFADFVHADAVLRKPFGEDEVRRAVSECCALTR